MMKKLLTYIYAALIAFMAVSACDKASADDSPNQRPKDDDGQLNILFIGNSFTKDAVEHLPGMISAAGLENIHLTHAYFGGRTIPQYYEGWSSSDDYTCYDWNSGEADWTSTEGKTLETIVRSRNWDIVTVQEHTGRREAWEWTDGEKAAVSGLVNKIRANQVNNTPELYYVLSQAYADLSKLPVSTSMFSTQLQMYGIISAQGEKVQQEGLFKGIIATGTTIQNLRTSSLNTSTDLTRDGFHLDYGLGRYAAACTVYETLISPRFDNAYLDNNAFRFAVSSTEEGKYSTPVTDDNASKALMSARFAMLKPFQVTDMSNVSDVKTSISSIYDLNSDHGYLNSHYKEWKSSSLELDYSSSVIFESQIATSAMYPRIKKLSDGSFMLMYQQGQVARNIYYTKTKNPSSWIGASYPLFQMMPLNQYGNDVEDKALFSSADAIVLSNGDILAFASFRLNAGYRLNNLNNGIMMRRSSDNGSTWTEPEIIFRGSTWEPSALQLSNGEIQVYFTNSDPNKGDSGTALLRSLDNGLTWTSVGKIIRQKSGTAIDESGDAIFTDQMPVAIQLNGTNSIAVAFESRFGFDDAAKYNVGLAYSDDNWASGGLSGDVEGPEDRQSNLYLNEAAPYLRQFRSGETILSDGHSGAFYLRLGNYKATVFGKPITPFSKSGFWGSIELIDDHTVIGVLPVTGTDSIQIAKFVLNHRINASAFTPSMVGSSDSWKDVKDALFIGSAAENHSVIRFAYDDNNVYCLVERSDKNVTASDGFTLYLQSGNASGSPLTIDLTVNVDGNSIVCGNKAVSVASTIVGLVDNVANDKGYVAVVSVPRSQLNISLNRILFNAVMQDADGNDSFTGLTSSNYNYWIPVELKQPAEPNTGGGDDDGYTGQTPGWGDGTEINPW